MFLGDAPFSLRGKALQHFLLIKLNNIRNFYDLKYSQNRLS